MHNSDMLKLSTSSKLIQTSQILYLFYQCPLFELLYYLIAYFKLFSDLFLLKAGDCSNWEQFEIWKKKKQKKKTTPHFQLTKQYISLIILQVK